MASKSFFRNFGDFQGLDLYKSLLETDSNFAVEFTNCEIYGRKSIRKRRGYKRAAQQATDGIVNLTPNCIGAYHGRFGSPPVQKSELIGVGSAPAGTGGEFSVLRTGTFLVIGPANSTFSFIPSSAGVWQADCKVAGVSVGGSFPLSAAGTTLADLKVEIDALGGGWSCTLTPYAKVSGAQVGRDHANPVAVDAGHTLSVASYFPLRPRALVQTTVTKRFYDIIEIAGNNIRFKTHALAAFNVADDAIIGIGLLSSYLLPITEDEECAGAGLTKTITFWEPHTTPYQTLFVHPANELAPTFKVLRDCAYFPANQNAAGGDWYINKYDGREAYVAGVPAYSVGQLLLAAVAGAGLGIGRYKYVAERIKTDAAGNEIHGNASDVEGESAVATTAGNQRVQVTVSGVTTIGTAIGRRQAVISGVAGPVNVLPVTAATNTLCLGDWIYFRDAAGALHNRQVVGLTDVTVTISGAAVNVTNAAPLDIISNMLIRLHRSKVGSNFLYYQGDYPDRAGAWNITDAVADVSLGELWGGPFLGLDRRDMPPGCAILEEHQGLLVGISDPDDPEALKWSNYDSPEYWSASTNFQPVPMGEPGKITALASDSLDTLVAFKESSFKLISGDLFSGSFSLTSEPRGDVGCPCSRGWVKSRGLIMFLSHGGPRTIVSGELQPIDTRLAETFAVLGWRDYLKYSHMALDTNRRRIYLINYALGSFVLDMVHGTWSKTTLPLTNYAIGGACNLGDKFYVNQLFYGPGNASFGSGELAVENDSGKKYDFIDHTSAITASATFAWNAAEDVGVDKSFLRAVLWAMDNGDLAACYPSDVLVEVFKNFGTVVQTSYPVNFAAYTDQNKEIPLVLDRARAIQLKLTNSTRLQPMHISGYEIEIALSFKKEHLKHKVL